MSTSVVAADERVAGVEFSEDSLTVRLMDGRSISVPLAAPARPITFFTPAKPPGSRPGVGR